MSFFSKLSFIAGDLDLQLSFKKKGSNITVGIFPSLKNADAQEKIKPIVMTGTPEELDEGFFEHLTPAIEKITGLARINHALVALGHPGLLVTVYDGDIVTDSNVGRQLYSIVDVGHNKAVLSVTRLNRYYSLDWMAIPEMYKKGSGMFNIMITCVDSAKTRIEIGNYLSSIKRSSGPEQRAIYWMDFGNTAKCGHVILGGLKDKDRQQLPLVTEVFDFSKLSDKYSGPSCSLAAALNKQDLFINSTLAQFGLNILWRMFREAKINHRGCFVNLDSLTVNAISV